jgi:hypothetical protein
MTQADPPAAQQGNPPTDTDTARWKYGIIVVALGLGAILAAVLIVLWRNPTGAGSVLGIVISPMAAIIGAYFGIQVSSSAAKDAQDRATTAEGVKTQALEDRAMALAVMDPQTVKEISPRLHLRL